MITTLRTPSASSAAATSGTGIFPTACWPPVIATAPLWSSLNVIRVPEAIACRTARLPE